jgi:hypothetical protein
MKILIFRTFVLLSFPLFLLNANMIDRTVFSIGGGQTTVGNETYGSGSMGVSFASHLQNNFYLGAEIDGAVFNGTDQTLTSNSGLDVLMNLSPLIGYRIGNSFYLYAKGGYTFGTLGGGEQTISGWRWGGMAQYDMTNTLTLGVSYMSGEISVDYVGGTRDETLSTLMLNLGMKF